MRGQFKNASITENKKGPGDLWDAKKNGGLGRNTAACVCHIKAMIVNLVVLAFLCLPCWAQYQSVRWPVGSVYENVGSNCTFALSSVPTASVFVCFVSSLPSVMAVRPACLIFGPSNSTQPQLLQVTLGTGQVQVSCLDGLVICHVWS
jgi:hypothetical protein